MEKTENGKVTGQNPENAVLITPIASNRSYKALFSITIDKKLKTDIISLSKAQNRKYSNIAERYLSEGYARDKARMDALPEEQSDA